MGEILPLTLERFRICELYAELLHCSSLSLLNRPPGFGPQYDSEGSLTGGLGGLEELARVISSNNDEQAEDETPPPSSRSMTQELDSPVASRGTMSSFASDRETDGSDFGGSRTPSDEGRSDEEDLGQMEEINVHDDTDSTINLRIPNSPQPSREPLPPAPFAVPSPRPSPQSQTVPLPGNDSSVDLTSPPSEPSQSGSAANDNDIDPFADDSPTASSLSASGDPEAEPKLSSSITSSTILEDSAMLASALGESIDQPTEYALRDEPKEMSPPPGEMFRNEMLKLNVLKTMLVSQLIS